MKLENIGFYSLFDDRAKIANFDTRLERNEIIITSKCNFKCPYCRGTDINGVQGDMELKEVYNVIDILASNNVRNIRFSGGEPTMHPNIADIVKYTKEQCVNIEHIAISTNGYSDLSLYKKLINLGVNDFSISLDACCSSTGDNMAGKIKGAWDKVVKNIKELSKLTYVTVGVVLTKQNAEELNSIIEFAHNLGVSDIRLITAAQWNDFAVFKDLLIKEEILEKHPILKYRINNFKKGRNVRGLKSTDNRKCPLVLDDMIIKGKYHYPCVIKMREGCEPLGEMGEDVRYVRKKYFENKDVFLDDTCRNNCLDVCIDYNNKWLEERKN